jgi:hypothetical protein
LLQGAVFPPVRLLQEIEGIPKLAAHEKEMIEAALHESRERDNLQRRTEDVSELQKLFKSENHGRPTLLDVTDLTLVDGDTVRFLDRCETDGIKLRNCPADIREWISRQRQGS